MESINISIYSDRVEMYLSRHEVVITIDRKESYLPTVFDLAVNYDENKYSEFHYRSVIAYYDIR